VLKLFSFVIFVSFVVDVSPEENPDESKMKVKIKFFAILRERVGAAEVVREIQEGTTIAQLWEALQREFPRLAVPGIRLLYAVNQNYVTPDRVLQESDEVVFVPPVSGG
jgi:molybdopterin converting factor subunit 1